MWLADNCTMFVTAFQASQVVINLFLEEQLHYHLITKDSRAVIY